MNRKWILTLLAGACLTTTTTTATAEAPAEANDPTLDAFGSCGDVRDMLADAYSMQLAHQFAYPMQPYGYGAARPGAVAMDSTRAEKSSAASSGPSTHTTTNVQEQGVDENDTVKTDGRYVYAVNGNDLVIAKSWPADEAGVVGRISLGQQTHPQSLFLKGDKVVLFSRHYEPGERVQHGGRHGHYWYGKPKFNGTRVSVIDVSDRAEPAVERHEDYEGWSSQARMIGSDVFFVFNSWLQAPETIWETSQYERVRRPKSYLSGDKYWAHVKKMQKRLKPQVRRLLAQSSMRDLLPTRRVVRPDGRVIAKKAAVSCSDLQKPPVPSTSMLGVMHFDIEDPSDRGSTAMFGNGWNVYASHDNLYVSGTTYGWSWWGGQQPEDNWYKTQIHKFALRGDDGQPEYEASGLVDGWLLNQFSMSEWDGHLRVGTTDWNVPGRNGGGNHLTILKQKGDKLVQTGAVRGLAKGERIFSMRMMGDIGYMVTFRQTDPLYTFDLSDPSKPQVLGELKINGFSSYIHPLGPDHLLTVGQDATDEGRILGLHLQIFDVSDLENPRRVHHKRLSGDRWSSWSPAMWNHHAFTFDASRNLLVLPVTSNQPEAFSGAMVMKADPRTGFEDFGFLTQNNEHGREWCEAAYNQSQASGYHSVCNSNSLMWYTQIQRTIIIDDYVVALSNLGVSTHSLREPHQVLGAAQLVNPPNNG